MEVYEAIKARRSIRSYKSEPIPEDKLRKVLSAARLAPSAKNLQPWKFIVVRDEETKRKLVGACNNQKFIAEAPVVIVACALPDEAFAFLGGYTSSWLLDLGIAFEHIMLQATEEGFATCWVGSFKEEKVKEVLGIPANIRVVALTPLGYANEVPEARARKQLEEIVCYDKWS
ncbi:MAG: nitroreductase family protein [Candidatus Thermoplasmatota archaeon]|nr:nitroreductase family protein [Candidatus Thermoplasmatota archaeon]